MAILPHSGAFAVILGLLAVAMVHGLTITQPLPNSRIQKGVMTAVKWAGITTGMVSIDLYNGPTLKVANLGTAVAFTSLAYVTVPTSVADGTNYYISVTDTNINMTQTASVGPLAISATAAVTTTTVQPSTSVSFTSSRSSISSVISSLSTSSGLPATTWLTRGGKSNNYSDDYDSSNSNSLSSGAIAGIAIGAAAAAGMAFGCIMCLRKGPATTVEDHPRKKYYEDESDYGVLAAHRIFADPSHHSPMWNRSINNTAMAVQAYYPADYTYQRQSYNVPYQGAYYESAYGADSYYYAHPVSESAQNLTTAVRTSYQPSTINETVSAAGSKHSEPGSPQILQYASLTTHPLPQDASPLPFTPPQDHKQDYEQVHESSHALSSKPDSENQQPEACQASN